MTQVRREVLLPYSVSQVFYVITDISSYSLFLEWCDHSIVDEHIDDEHLLATLGINFHGVRQSFQTKNTMIKDQLVEMSLVKGPFKTLHGQWIIDSIDSVGDGKSGSFVKFHLEYEFSGKLLEKLISPIFDRIAQKFVDSFVQRMEQLYGGGHN